MLRPGHLLRQAVLFSGFGDSASYWERRYRLGGTSGASSVGPLAAFKAEILNRFVRDRGLGSVVEFGCGDGRQLALSDYPLYLGLDVSRTSIAACRARFADDPGKSFLWYDPARRSVIVYASNRDERAAVPHVRHRALTRDVARRCPAFRLVETIENRYPDDSDCSFFFFERTETPSGRR